MSQMSFSDFEYASKRKQTRRERFLAEMDQVVPWTGLLGLIEPFYPKAGGGRKPYPLETMLRIHLLQNWFSLSDPAMEEALYEITPMRQFARLTLSAPIPEDTTIMNFRHLLEKHQLAPAILAVINGYLQEKGLSLRQGIIVDATIIHAPSSTKNEEGKRDPEMHQTKKGNQYFFGMKAHIGADAEWGWFITSMAPPPMWPMSPRLRSCCMEGVGSGAFLDRGSLHHAARQCSHAIAFKLEKSIPAVGFQQAWDRVKMSTLTLFLR